MSQDNVELARRLADAFNRRDLEALFDTLDPDVEWVPIMAVLEGRVYRGHDGVREWIEHLSVDWDIFEPRQEEFLAVGNRVLILGYWRARARGSGVELPAEQASWVLDMRDGKVVRMQTYTDRKEALEAAGLPE